jgi:hypothetical protein
LRRVEAHRGAPAILAYERPDTDDQPLHFSCREGRGRIFAGISDAPAGLARITLQAGDRTLALAGITREAREVGLSHFTSRAIAGHSPFLRAFARHGALRLIAEGHARDMPAGSAESARAIARFVARCRRR